ncbi:MAG: phosphoribosylglycinamide formyltransferase [Bacteroidetes bacterium GWF2_33_16]|nr:MAG: phosphoribosylglycinamide formyltransferase [Bacteroidetes bacterium GWE2_32_14]OFY03888.1 MAG: phosphoribosylglycinamide formyltransferase [Bacteroidetes bacterium GWF2_33_16]
MNKIAIFASGSGTNAENLIRAFKENKKIEISVIFSNNKNAFVIQRAINHGIKYHIFSRPDFYQSQKILELLRQDDITYIVLAGFLWLIPEYLIDAYPNKIINIHPALLPKYGGKGMFGMNVHETVVRNKETETGISIHYVNKEYDKGSIIFQAKCPVLSTDTPEDIANKVHELEYMHFPRIIEQILSA